MCTTKGCEIISVNPVHDMDATGSDAIAGKTTKDAFGIVVFYQPKI